MTRFEVDLTALGGNDDQNMLTINISADTHEQARQLAEVQTGYFAIHARVVGSTH